MPGTNDVATPSKGEPSEMVVDSYTERPNNTQYWFSKLRPHMLFKTGVAGGPTRFFVAARKINIDFWEVIELTAENRRLMVGGSSPVTSTLGIADASGIRIWSDPEPPQIA